MGRLVYDELSLVDQQMHKYDKFLHSRINKYTDAGRTIVEYYNINDNESTLSLGLETNYAILGKESPLRYNKIENMLLVGFTPLTPEETTAGSTTVRNYALAGEAIVYAGTIMPKENDFFIIKHLNMNHLMRVDQVTQDGLNTDGSYKINWSLFSTNPYDLESIKNQTVSEYVMDLQTIGGDDLTPVIGKTDYEMRSRLLEMVDDMIESYISQFYDQTHNCFICHLNGISLFDACGNMFMAKHGVMITDNTSGNIVLNDNKLREPRIDLLYQKSPYKWIERDAPYRYLDTFKYHITKSYNYVDSSFAMYGTEVDVMIPNDPWCNSPQCDQFFPNEVHAIFEQENDPRECCAKDCRCCPHNQACNKHFKLKRYDYVSIIHDFIHGKLTSLDKLSLYTGDQLFDLSMAKEIYLWTPIIIYILKQTLKIQ